MVGIGWGSEPDEFGEEEIERVGVTGRFGWSKAGRGLSGGDVVAGISVALILIPQSLAYALIAGVPSHVGLYAAALPLIAAAVFASSPYLQTGPGAMTALLAFGALSAIAVPFTPEYVALAALLAVVVGVVRVLLGVLRAGVIAFFMSQPVLVGFTSAAAALIVASQMPPSLGVVAEGDKLLTRAWWALAHPRVWDWETVLISVLTVVVVAGGRRVGPRFPGVLAAVVAGVVYSGLTSYTGATVGEIPAGFPPLSVDLPWSQGWLLIVPGVVIALVGFAEPASIARMFATQDRQKWNPDREFVAQGVANLVSGFSGGLPVGGSFSRSSINRLAGAKTRWSGAITGATVLLFLPFSSILSTLPLAVLAAIVITAVVRMIRLDLIVGVLRDSRPQGAVAAVTFVATLVLAPRIDLAVLVGIGLGVAVHLWRELSARVHAEYRDGTLWLMPSGVMFFGSAPPLTDALLSELAAHPDATSLVIDLSGLGRIDYTGAVALQTIVTEARAAGLDAGFGHIPDHAERILGRVLADGVPPGDR